MKTNILRLIAALSLACFVSLPMAAPAFAAPAPANPFATTPCNPPSGTTSPLSMGSNSNLTLLQPLDGTTNCLPPSPNIQIFTQYFNMAWPWVLGVAAGIGVLQSLIGGIEVMMSGSDSGLRESGKSKIMWALAGLLMVGLAGFILRSLNPLFYT